MPRPPASAGNTDDRLANGEDVGKGKICPQVDNANWSRMGTARFREITACLLPKQLAPLLLHLFRPSSILPLTASDKVAIDDEAVNRPP